MFFAVENRLICPYFAVKRGDNQGGSPEMHQQVRVQLSDMEPADRMRAVRACLRGVFDIARGGKPRLEFIRAALTEVHGLISCSTAHVVLIDRTRHCYARATRAESGRSVCLISGDEPAYPAPMVWTEDVSGTYESLCRQVAAAQIDTSRPWMTDSGCLLIGDLVGFPHDLTRARATAGTGRLSIANGARSIMVLPIEGTRRVAGLLQLESDTAGFFTPDCGEHYLRLAQGFGMALDVRNLQVDLRERVKELSCLYGIARLFARTELSVAEILEGAVALLVQGWLYPEVAAARIVLDDRMFASAGADAIRQRMTAPIMVNGSPRGSIEVGYTEDRPAVDDGPFRIEERHLIETVAQELAFVIEQKTVDEERRRLQEQVRRADRLATIGQLAAGVAHELNEPLSTIIGFAQLAGRNARVPEDVTRDLDRIVTAALHARKVIRELLVFARETAPVAVSCNLNELIRDGLFFLDSRFAKAGIRLVCDLAPDLPAITADRSQMLQVLTNLAVNSVQAMPHGGRLEIATRHDRECVTLSITDSGIGMDEATVGEIFHPFFTTKDVSEGTGLGLSVVHGIVTSHQGTIDVATRPGEGTRFVIKFPLACPTPDRKESYGATC